MNYHAEPLAIIIFVIFVLAVLVLSWFFARKAKSASGYFAAGGKIHWGVNGIAFAGDYLSAASFLGIAGLVAIYGYDGFLYSRGYLAGWMVALFVVAEPLKKLGKYTFADAIDAKFKSRGVILAAAVSTPFRSSRRPNWPAARLPSTRPTGSSPASSRPIPRRRRRRRREGRST